MLPGEKPHGHQTPVLFCDRDNVIRAVCSLGPLLSFPRVRYLIRNIATILGAEFRIAFYPGLDLCEKTLQNQRMLFGRGLIDVERIIRIDSDGLVLSVDYSFNELYKLGLGHLSGGFLATKERFLLDRSPSVN